MAQDTHFVLHCGDSELQLSSPVVMGILNVTPDSFFDGGKHLKFTDAMKRAEQMISEGARIIDVGAVSTRPGSTAPEEGEEWTRMQEVILQLKKDFPHTLISVDTYRSGIAAKALDAGVHIINDISGGLMDDVMMDTVARYNVPYVCMHMQGTPETMQKDPVYTDVVQEVFDFLQAGITKGEERGLTQCIIDPGFGFGKTLEHNYSLLNSLEQFHSLRRPLLVGFSRKSMITKLLGIKKEDALNGTTALNTIALMKGAHILRVHDVKEAMECVKITGQLDLFS